MSRVRPAVTLLAVALVGTVLSQPPTTPRKSSQPEQGKIDTKETKSSSNNSPSPFSVNVYQNAALPTEANQQKLADQGRHEVSSDWWMTFGTLVMAVATVAVAICNFFQNMSLRDQVTLAQNTLLENRRATDIATRTYIASHRPKPTVRFVSISDEIIVSNTISGTLMIFNTGETSATLQRYYSEIANRQDSSCTKRELYIGRWKKGSVTRWLLVCL